MNWLTSMNAGFKEALANQLVRCNQDYSKNGLALTVEEAEAIVAARNHVLKSYGRVELGTGAIIRLIKALCNSAYIDQEDYGATLRELQELFYYMKNETEDSIGDEELVQMITSCFNDDCQGSKELLRQEMESYARRFRWERQVSVYLHQKEETEWE